MILQAKHNSLTSTYDSTDTASPIISKLPNANEVLRRPQSNGKPPTFFGEPVPSDLIHELNKKRDKKFLYINIFRRKAYRLTHKIKIKMIKKLTFCKTKSYERDRNLTTLGTHLSCSGICAAIKLLTALAMRVSVLKHKHCLNFQLSRLITLLRFRPSL